MTPNPEDVLDAASVLREILRPLVERLDAQDATMRAQAERIAVLEARPIGCVDGGVWTAGRVYERGTGTTHGGAYWVAQRETLREPADGNDDWRLAVSRGRQGKQGPPGPPGRDALARVAS